MSDVPREPVAPEEQPLENPEAEEIEDGEAEADGDDEASIDAGGDGAEGEAEGQAGTNGPVTPPRQGRARGRPDGERLREADRRIADLERVIQGMQQQAQQPRQPSPAEIAEAQRQERERFEMMSPYEQFQYARQQMEQSFNQRLQVSEQRVWEQQDEREYEQLLRDNPRFRTLDARVQELKRQAPATPRAWLLRAAIGDAVLNRAPAARTRAATAAAAGAARNGAQPSVPRGDVGSERGRRGDDPDERLRGVQI